mmetsp:Transcript_170511/g.546902  ORF Transcript_170511/g.546902 Transcript_170511/m.546902 type:complete len:249 (+) Transcript_170511:867-1613(+)
MTIQLRHDDTPNLHSISKGLCLVVACLADVRIHHKDDVVGLDGFLNLLHLLEQGHLLLVPPARVDDDQVVLLEAEGVHALQGHGDRVRLRVAAVERYADLGGVLLQLVEGPGAEGVRADQGDLPAFPLVEGGVLGARRRLARALEADEHRDHRPALRHLHRRSRRGQELCQLLDHQALDVLAAVRPRGERLLEAHLVPDPAPQPGHEADVDVGLQQRGRQLLEVAIDRFIIDDGPGIELLQRLRQLAA